MVPTCCTGVEDLRRENFSSHDSAISKDDLEGYSILNVSRYVLLPVWPDVGIKKSPNISKVKQK